MSLLSSNQSKPHYTLFQSHVQLWPMSQLIGLTFSLGMALAPEVAITNRLATLSLPRD